MFAPAYMGRERIFPMPSLHAQGFFLPQQSFGPHSKSVGGSCAPSFSSHVRWCEHGAPVQKCQGTNSARFPKGKSPPNTLTPGPLTLGDAGCDHVQGAVSGKCRAFLPTDDMAGVVAGKVDAPLGLDPNLVAWRGTHVGITDPGPKVVGDVSPADIDGVLQRGSGRDAAAQSIGVRRPV